MDLPGKLRRRPHTAQKRRNKWILGRSIEECPTEIENREKFGRWEIGIMIGSKSSDDKVLLTMKEWKTRLFLVVPVKDKTHGSILEAVKKQMSRWQGHIGGIFKAITADSGSEFADLSSVE